MRLKELLATIAFLSEKVDLEKYIEES
uniref:Uncharacterized protein n=1 Tax=Arundo donax TaxID=35708 RepID=A0A0A8YPB2_ARUDO